jgi:putative protease
MTNSQSTLIKPELLMPAGSLEKLKYAFAYGADAVYAGVPLFSLRARENEFALNELQEGLALARSQDKKLYLTANVFARNVKVKPFIKHLDDWAQLKPDAMIMGDPGLISLVKERHPEIAIHLSVQANCMNWRAVKFWHDIGVERVILSRELRLEEIQEIKQRVPEMELEAFVHGSICIAYSGRCLLSHYMSYRDANQGVCDNSCRYQYNVFKTSPQKEQEDYYIEDLRNKGEFYRINEDENGTYIMNAKDLRVIEFLREVAEAGVCSFKIEGRTKSIYYLSLTTRAYRQAIDDMVAGKEFDPKLIDELDKVANRGYHSGFIVRQLDHQEQNYDTSISRHQTQSFAARYAPESASAPFPELYPFEVRNRLSIGQDCELLSPGQESQLLTINRILNNKGNDVDTAHGGAGLYYLGLDLENPPSPYSLLSLIGTAVDETGLSSHDCSQSKITKNPELSQSQHLTAAEV